MMNDKEVAIGLIEKGLEILKNLKDEEVIKPTPVVTVFHMVMEHVLKNEGGYSDHPNDHGGATMYGITIGRLKEHRGKAVTKDDVKNLSLQEALAIYKKYYWDKMGLDLIKTFPKAMVIMDQGVNFGPSVGVKRAQKVCNDNFGKNLNVDGKLGELTAKELNSLSDVEFCKVYLDASLKHYESIVANNPSQKVFIKGWTNRVNNLRKLVLV